MSFIPGKLSDVPLGYGVTKASGTVYHNDTQRPLFLSIIATVSSTSAFLDLLCDASNPPTTTVVSKKGDASTTVTIHAVVPIGYYYKLTASSGTVSSVTSWIEHYLPGVISTQSQPARSLSTHYQNTGSGPRIVMASLFLNSFGPPDIRIGSANPATTVVMQSMSAARDMFFAIVPPSWYYTIPADGGNSIVYWTEYDWTNASVVVSPTLVGRGAPTAATRYFNGEKSGTFVVVCTRDGNRTAYGSQSNITNGYNTGDGRVLGSITSLCTASGGATGLEYAIMYVPPGEGYNWYTSSGPDSIPVWIEYYVSGY